MYADAVDRLAGQALASRSVTTVEHMSDAALLALALRNVVRAGEMARELVEEAERPKIDEALAAFDAAMPDAGDARDVLEHFDAYAAGIGFRQIDEREAGRAITTYRVFYQRGRDSYILHVGPLRVDVAAARDVAARLAAVVALLEAPSLPPPSPDAMHCTHVRYVGPAADGQLHVVEGGKWLAPGERVPYPGIWRGQPDRTPAGGYYVVEGFEVYSDDLIYAVAGWQPDEPGQGTAG